MKAIRYFALSLCLLWGVSCAAGPKSPSESLNIGTRFSPSGYMGCGEQDGFVLIQRCPQDVSTKPGCVKVDYTRSCPDQYAGVYWMNKAGNWCLSPGEDFSNVGYRSVSFRAKGQSGGEFVEFKAGGIACENRPFRDSFEVTSGRIALTQQWQSYEIDLTGEDLSSVIGGFCWVVANSYNPDGATFYLEDIYYAP